MNKTNIDNDLQNKTIEILNKKIISLKRDIEISREYLREKNRDIAILNMELTNVKRQNEIILQNDDRIQRLLDSLTKLIDARNVEVKK